MHSNGQGQRKAAAPVKPHVLPSVPQLHVATAPTLGPTCCMCSPAPKPTLLPSTKASVLPRQSFRSPGALKESKIHTSVPCHEAVNPRTAGKVAAGSRAQDNNEVSISPPNSSCSFASGKTPGNDVDLHFGAGLARAGPMFLFGWKRQRTGSCCLLPFPAAAHPRCLGGDALKDSSANGWQRSKRLCLLCPLWCLRSRQPFRPWPHACKKKKRRPCAVRRNCSWNKS